MNKKIFNKTIKVVNKGRRQAVLATALSPFIVTRGLADNPPDGPQESTLLEYLQVDKKHYISAVEKIEDGRIGMVAGDLPGSYLSFANDIKNVTYSERQGKRVRVVPMINNGSIQTLSDLMFLKATDLGILQADVMQNVQELHKQGNIEAGNMINHLRYVTKFYDEEVHLLTNGFDTIEQLTNAIINVGARGSGTQFTADRILRKLNLNTRKKTYDSSERALDELKNGRIHAMFLVVGKPSALFTRLASEWSAENYNFVPIVGDFGPEYSVSYLDKTSYPFLDNNVKTISVPSVLAAYNHSNKNRKKNLERFSAAFLENLEELQSHSGKDRLYHPKWQEFFDNKNLYADVSGWTRLEAMENLL